MSPPAPDSEPASRRSPWPARRRAAARWSLALMALGCTAVVAYAVVLVRSTPGAYDLRLATSARPSVLLSADGQTLATFARGPARHVTLDEVSPVLVEALLATEDHRFHEHHGVDVKRLIAAAYHSCTGRLQGGSTITQQLARNLFPDEIGRSRSLQRKLKELVTALRIEQLYSKRQILEAYLNTVPFLFNAVGVEMAAHTYWGKTAAQLDALESATLVGMLKGPGYYNPVLNPERARQRRNLVLAQMHRRGTLSAADYRRLAAQPLQVNLTRPADGPGLAPHFTAQARKWLLAWAESSGHDLYTDGLVIEATLDMPTQRAAERAVARQAEALQHIADVEWGRPMLGETLPQAAATPASHRTQPFAYFWKTHTELLATAVRETPEYRRAVEGGLHDAQALRRLMADRAWLADLKARKTRLEAGFVALDPRSGDVKAWVGSRDFDTDQYDHVAQATRQPGSTFKPFVYGAALERGMRPQRSYVDHAVAIQTRGGAVWRPTDMTAPTGNAMTLRDGLVYSRNTITAQVMQDVGIPSVVALARAAGVSQSRLDPVPSLALGTSPVTLLEMASAYATIANEGVHRQPLLIKRIRDREGHLLAEFGAPPQRAMSPDTAVTLVDMMRGVVNRGTGTLVRTRFGIAADIAGKTGTTQNNTDGWFILMHPQLVAGAWVGFNDSRVTMRSNYWGQGGHNAILLVGDFFREALRGHLLDTHARFAEPRTPQALMASWAPVADARDGASIARLEVDPEEVSSAFDDEEDAPPKTSQELDAVVRNLGTGWGTSASLGVGAQLRSP
ncbi:MAG: transglycosylase domain-containing protein [Rhizobacter sp.]|nr:transglycosylase domain-containing protein [Rhizobacter sp.]